MNYIIHGENSTLSRQKMNEIKDAFDPSLVFQNPSGLLGNSLFSTPGLILLEFFKKEELKTFAFEEFFKNLGRVGPKTQVALWFNFELGTSNKILSQSQNLNFKELKFSTSPVVFKIVDAFFAPKKFRSNFYRLLSDFSQRPGEEIFLLQMLIRHSRLYLWAGFENSSFKNLKGFTKNQAQAGKEIALSRLVELFKRLVELEKQFKGGFLDLPSKLLVLYEQF